MFFANDDKGTRVNICYADPQKMYFCPQCKEAVVQRHGSINEHCFAHNKGYECEKWACMSKWHNEWQMNFPDDTQEVILRGDTEMHRADISIHNMVIEFQGSQILYDELEKRISFYTQHGILVFVFNEIDKQIRIKERIAYWSSPSRSIVPPNNKSYFLFFQIADDKLILVDRQIDGWSKFRIFKEYSKEEFIQIIKDNYLIMSLYECMCQKMQADINIQKDLNDQLHKEKANLKKKIQEYEQENRDLKSCIKKTEKALIEGVLNEVGRYISVAKTNDEREQLYPRELLETNLKKVIEHICNKVNNL